jgi:hypothetical protein
MSHNIISSALEAFGGTPQTRQAIKNSAEAAYATRLFITASGKVRHDILQMLEGEREAVGLHRIAHDIVRNERFGHETKITASGPEMELYSGNFKMKFLKCRTCDKVIHITHRPDCNNDLKNFYSPCGHGAGLTDRGYSPIKTIDAMAYLGQTGQRVEDTYVKTS